jgi:hypothetical protein
VLCYSAEDPPTERGLVLVDAIDGRIVEHLRELNPEVDTPLDMPSSAQAGSPSGTSTNPDTASEPR